MAESLWNDSIEPLVVAELHANNEIFTLQLSKVDLRLCNSAATCWRTGILNTLTYCTVHFDNRLAQSTHAIFWVVLFSMLQEISLTFNRSRNVYLAEVLKELLYKSRCVSLRYLLLSEFDGKLEAIQVHPLAMLEGRPGRIVVEQDLQLVGASSVIQQGSGEVLTLSPKLLESQR